MTKRKEGESYSDYKLRRKVENLLLKKKLKGIMYWNSNERKTYTKDLEAKLIAESIEKKETEES
tara:strand:+ start:2723 stop:2914 length:192 start_codon:yes stop_codon:yes gene_type:complete